MVPREWATFECKIMTMIASYLYILSGTDEFDDKFKQLKKELN